VGVDPSELGRLIDELPPERLEPVFTHSSWAPDRASSYERLEFLGDSVLELAVARELYERYPDFSEGRMAKIRSHVVSRASCAVVARELGLGARLAAQGKDVPAEEVKRLTTNKNVLAALLEAALAALFLERGFEAIERAVVAAFQARIQYALTTHVDHKTELQEALAALGSRSITASSTWTGRRTSGGFTCAAIVDGEQRASARARRRRRPSRKPPSRRSRRSASKPRRPPRSRLRQAAPSAHDASLLPACTCRR